VHSSQGLTCDKVLIEADAHSLTANSNSFYVAISRARLKAQIYTDDREMLSFAMSRQIENLSALDIQRPVADLVDVADYSSYEIA
jgi:ATP-dependent exoDNAse (exonuclease V) alpha subunit